MAKKVYMFGPRNIDRARQHAQRHAERELVLLRSPDRRIAVCTQGVASELKTQGFTAIDPE